MQYYQTLPTDSGLVNVYSHLLGAVFFTATGAVLLKAFAPRYATATPADIKAFGCFFLGSFLCLGMSGTYHLMHNHSPRVSYFFNKLDYLGIVFMITGSFVASVYYGFYCRPDLQKFYWIMVFLTILILSTVLTRYRSLLLALAVLSHLPFPYFARQSFDPSERLYLSVWEPQAFCLS
jgi:predicted membrane channel-forming protein YqfA (hemolysin III family)